MQAFIIRRMLALLPTILFTSIIVFASIRMIPGDVIDLMLAQNDISSDNDRAVIEAALGFDKPIYIFQRYIRSSNVNQKTNNVSYHMIQKTICSNRGIIGGYASHTMVIKLSIIFII